MTKGRIRSVRWVRLHDPIYRVTHYIYLGLHKDIETALNATLTAPEREAVGDAYESSAYGRTCGRQPKHHPVECPYFITVWVNSTPGADVESTLVHELAHAAGMALDFVGVTPSFSNDEAFAYYLTWLTAQSRKGLGLCK